MLSRVADSVFWMSRYIERAENIARFIDVNQHMALDDYSATQWEPLVAITGDVELFQERYGTPTRDNVLQFLTFDTAYPNSIRSCVQRARENARTIREIISSEMWEELNQLYHFMERSAKEAQLVLLNPYAFLSAVRRASFGIIGLTNVTMSHGEAWHFGNMGRLLERADKTSRILDVKYFILLPKPTDVGTTIDALQWGALLKSASGLHMYRRRHGRITPSAVAEFLLLDTQFPRSVRFCLTEAERSLVSVSRPQRDRQGNRAELLLGRLRSELEFSQIPDVIQKGMHQFIDDLQRRLNQIGSVISDTFFTGRVDAAQGQWQ